jgi:hypothetical protein
MCRGTVLSIHQVIPVLDEVSTGIHGGEAAMNVRIYGRIRSILLLNFNKFYR